MSKKAKPDAKRVAAITKRVETLANRNAKARVKQFYTDAGAESLIEAITLAMSLPVMPELPNAEARRAWCIANNAPSVQRDEVCRKATNYRADNAVRARIASLQKDGKTISKMVTVVWAVNHAMAKAEPFTVASEKVFIVRTK